MPKVAKPRKHGSRWQINWSDSSGKRRWQSFSSYKEALEALRNYQAETDAERHGTRRPVEGDHSWEDLVGLWKEVKHAKRTLKDDLTRIRLHLNPAFGRLLIADVTARRIARMERGLSGKIKIGTVRQVLSLLRGMLNLAVEHRWLLAAPKIRLPSQPEQTYAWLRTREDHGALLRAAKTMDYPGLVELYATALYTGMRAGELCGLRWADVDLELRLITVQHSFNEPTKTNAIPRVPILDPLLPLLREWQLRCSSREIVFPNRNNKMHVSNARATHQIFHRCLKQAGLARTRFHDLRHTFASHWMLEGGDLYRLQKILGHKSIAMTQRYAHLSPDAFQQDWGRLADIVPKEGNGEVIELEALPL